MNSYKCIIFDFDGTLADTHTGIVKTFQETIRQMGLPVPSVERVTSTIGLVLKDGLKAGVDGMTEEQAEKACEIYRRIFPETAIPCINTFPGIPEFLKSLKDRGFRLAIATSRSHHSLDILTEKLGIRDFFEGLYGAEDIVRHKPAPDLALHILKEFKLNASDALVVGDATYDLLMGKGAGCKVCGVTWGNQSIEELQSADPEYIVSTLEELSEIIK